MSILTIATPPFNAIEDFKRVMAAAGSEPDGLEARYVVGNEGGLRVVAIWQTREHFEAFRPVLGKALADALGEPAGQPQMEWFNVLDTHVSATQDA